MEEVAFWPAWALLELKLTRNVGDNKMISLKYSVKRQCRNDISLLQEEHGDLTVRDTDKVEMFNAFFASAFNTDDGLPWLWKC